MSTAICGKNWKTVLDLDLQFQSLQAMVVIHTHAKDQGQRSVGLKYRVETDGQMDGQMDTDGRGDCITSCANMVGKDTKSNIFIQ